MCQALYMAEKLLTIAFQRRKNQVERTTNRGVIDYPNGLIFTAKLFHVYPTHRLS